MDESSDYSRTYDNSGVVAVSGKIMVAAIIVLFLVIIFILGLHLYSKWFWRRRGGIFPSRISGRRFIFAPNQDPVLLLHQGLEPSVIESLPVMVFNSEQFEDGLECAVCLCEISDGEKARLLPKCSHGFHVECIDMWFQSHSTCPLCRNSVVPGSSNSTPELPIIESHDENSESLNLPTNVLFWGNQTQIEVNGRYSNVEEEPEPSSSSSSSSSSYSPSRRPEGTLVIEIPRRLTDSLSALSPSGNRFCEEESKSPLTGRLRSLKRLLSREKRVINPCSPNSVDVEQGEGGRGQSSKMAI